MPFVAVEDTSSLLPEVPFVSDWSKRKANDGSTFVVTHVLLCSKGLILFTSEFKTFVWKSERMHNAVLEHLGNSFNPDAPTDSIAVQVVVTSKKGYVAGFDSDVKGYWSEEGTTYTFTSLDSAPSVLPTLESVPKSVVSRAPKNGR